MRVRLRRSSARTLMGLALGMLLAGCATMPDSGVPASETGSQSGDTQATQVVVVAVRPQAGEQPQDLLVGFLDDLVSDEPDYSTAKEYLADPSSWNPNAQVTVLDHILQTPVSGSLASGRMTFSVSGHVEATLNARQDFIPPGHSNEVQEQFSFVRNAKGLWQISSLPQGLIIRESDFQRLYESANLYFPARGSLSTSGVAPLVAEPIWVRSRIDPLEDAARALVSGPPPWLHPVVSSAFPAGVSVDSVTADSDGTAKVVLGSRDKSLLDDPATCQEMAAQMYATLSSVPAQQSAQASQQVTSAALYRGSSSTQACSSGASSPYTPVQAPGDAIAYYVGANGRLQSLDMLTGNAAATPGTLEPAGNLGISSFAVAPGTGGEVAVVPRSGQDLYVGTLAGSASSQHSALHGPANSISSPSWDETGTLWVVDNDPASPSQVVALTADGATQVPVTVEGLPAGATVSGLRVSEDGARIALIVNNGSTSTADVGWVMRSGSISAPVLTIFGLHDIAVELTSVQAVSWMDDDSLIVLGQSLTSAKALSTWEVDGSSAVIPAPAAPQATSGMTTVSALESDLDPVKAPLLGDSSGDATDSGKIYAWEAGANPNWKVRAKGATGGPGPMPRYPG